LIIFYFFPAAPRGPRKVFGISREGMASLCVVSTRKLF
jgi:hypothetical protein